MSSRTCVEKYFDGRLPIEACNLRRRSYFSGEKMCLEEGPLCYFRNKQDLFLRLSQAGLFCSYDKYSEVF